MIWSNEAISPIRSVLRSIPRSESHKAVSVLRQIVSFEMNLDLHCILQGNYDSQTKLAVKVFHIQELASGPLKHKELSLDHRYTRLTTDLLDQDVLRTLSATQLTSLCLSCFNLGISDSQTWSLISEELLKSTTVTEMSTSSFCVHRFCRSLATIAKMPLTPNTNAVNNSLNSLMKKYTLLNGDDISCILFFIRQSKPNGENRLSSSTMGALQLLITTFNTRLDELNPNRK